MIINKKIHINTYKKIAFAGVFIVFIGIIMLYCYKINFDNFEQTNVNHVYKSHYAFIADNMEDPFISDIYKSAKKLGASCDIYVDSFTDSYTIHYTKADYLSIAIATKVDGIILVGENNSSLSSLVDTAINNNIPVVTLLNDCTNSSRKSFIRIDSYNIGCEYGNLIIDFAKNEHKESVNIALFSKASPSELEKTLLCNGIKDTLSNNPVTKGCFKFNTVLLEDGDAFSSAEATRNLLISSEVPPDIIICLTKEDTLNVYATLLDLVKIDSVKIIGFYASTEILDAISHRLIYSTFEPDTNELGSQCIQALNSYIETGKVAAKTTVENIDIITSKNVNDYLKKSLEENAEIE